MLVVTTFKPLISRMTLIASVNNYTRSEVLALWLYSTLTHYYTSGHTESVKLLLSCPFSFIESASFFTGVSLIHLLSSFYVHLLVFPTIGEYQTNYRDSPYLPNVKRKNDDHVHFLNILVSFREPFYFLTHDEYI